MVSAEERGAATVGAFPSRGAQNVRDGLRAGQMQPSRALRQVIRHRMADTLLQRWSQTALPSIRAPSQDSEADVGRKHKPHFVSRRDRNRVRRHAAFCWALAFAVAKHGIMNGMSPADLALHRFVWTGALMLPFLARQGLSDLGGVGWGRGFVLMLFGGPLQAFLAYYGFTIVPLGHGTVIQPAFAVVMGALLSAWILREHLSVTRIAGMAIILAGLSLFGAEALATMGTHGAAGDLLFVGAGTLWAMFSVALRRWSVSGVHAMAVVSVLALLDHRAASRPCFRLSVDDRGRPDRKSHPGFRAGLSRRSRADLSLRALGFAAWLKPRLDVPGPCAGLRRRPRHYRDRRNPDRDAARRACNCRDRIQVRGEIREIARLDHPVLHCVHFFFGRFSCASSPLIQNVTPLLA